MLLLVVPCAQAIPVRWTLDSVNFNDGTAATGGFTFDASDNSFSDLLITTLGAAAVTYTTADVSDSFFGSSPSNIELIRGFVPNDNVGKSVLNLAFAGFLTDAGGRLDLVNSYPSFQGSCIQPDCSFGSVDRQVISGSVRGTSIPEPTGAALLILGLGMLIRMRRGAARSSN